MSAHTPGPWEMWTSNSFRRIGSRYGAVCEPIVQNDGHPDLHFRNGGPEGPDAVLLLAGPDLVLALKSIRDQVYAAQTRETRLNDIHDIASAALARVGVQ